MKRRKYAPVGANWGVDEPGEMMNLNKTLESSRKIDGPSAPPQPINIVRETLSDRISGTKIEDGEHGHEGDGIERVQDGGGVEHANVLKCEVRKKMCIIHNRTARKLKVYKEAWTKSKKTGLYYMSKRNVLEWRCDGHALKSLLDNSIPSKNAEV